MATAGETLRREAVEEVEYCDKAGKGCQELHVLAVDDSHVDRKVVEKLLKRLSCKVTAVESARSALQFLGLDGERDSTCLNALEVNLVITDYSMPGMTGYELLKKIKEESSAIREVPVVVMSSEKILAHIDKCLEEGAEEFLSKPLKLHDVERLMDSLMRDKGRFHGSCGNTKSKRMSNCDTLPLPQSSVMLRHPNGCGMSPPLQPPSSLVAPSSSSECSPKRLKVNA